MKQREPKDWSLTEQLAERAGIRLHRSLRMELIAAADAHAFLDACAAQGTRVLGIEGFYLRGSELQPDMTRIGDFSSVDDVERSIDESRDFVDAVAVPELMLDFALDP
jgi:hypothetical protein